MRTLLLSLVVLLAPASGHAMCVDYREGGPLPPAFRLCLGDQCETTTLVHECGNIHMGSFSFENGWYISGGDASWSADGKPYRFFRINEVDVPRPEWSSVSCEGDADEVCAAIGNILFEQPSPETAAAIDAWNTAHYECRMMETRDGKPLSLSESDGRCKARAKLNDTLVKLGQCWDSDEQSWEQCH